MIADRASLVMLVPRFSTLLLAGMLALMVEIAMTRNVGCCLSSPNDLMKIQVDKIATDWHSRWMFKTGGTCPANLVEVALAVGALPMDIEDVWDAPMRFVCMPDGALRVYSLGEDGLDGTADDIRSWERRRRR